MPVGNAPVVLNDTAVPLAGAVVTETTAGFAIEIVAVCVAVVSAAAQFVASKSCFTNAVVATCVLFESGEGVTAKLMFVAVCVPDPVADVATSGDSVGDADTLKVVASIFDT